MNYKLVYEHLVKRGQLREVTDKQYYERHHIIPRCMGGCDDEENIVALTAREHFIAHKLLVKIHPNVGGLWAAIRFMNDISKDYNLTSKQYQIVREKYSEYRKVPTKITACITCKKEFNQRKHLDHKFCSMQCWGKSKTAPIEERECKNCEKKFKAAVYKSQNFCSMKCVYESKRKEKKKKKYLTCPQCKNMFTVGLCRIKKVKSEICCSRKCAYNFKTKDKVNLTCATCNSNFTRSQTYVKNRQDVKIDVIFFCSRACSYKHRTCLSHSS